ncbi:hypothetical protein MP228_011328 [Amoeboaphelidium protococcarum]|nr:hypothetical protein MP228_011328 [Amoeboaphelidium protococcarum]
MALSFQSVFIILLCVWISVQVFLKCDHLFKSIFYSKKVIATFPQDFDFGIASAPAHVEDEADDLWMEWTRPANESKIPHFYNVPHPEKRLQFWTRPEVEIGLMKDLGVNSVRVGIDWGRVVPHMPGSLNCNRYGYVQEKQSSSQASHHNAADSDFRSKFWLSKKYPCREGVQDVKALRRYVKIINQIKQQGINVMLTFFHHSLPKWSDQLANKGWTSDKMPDYFAAFVHDVVPHVKHVVDRYVVLNEPAWFANAVYGIGMWPGRINKGVDPNAYWKIGKYEGNVVKAMRNMAKAHSMAYELIHHFDDEVGEHTSSGSRPAVVGIAKNMAYYVSIQPKMISTPLRNFMDFIMNRHFMDLIATELDFIGINYYGKEFVGPLGLTIRNGVEYSEAGRAISPYGFYKIIQTVHQEYNVAMGRNLPIMITENGISDDTDILRPAYLIEHLLVLRRLLDEGVPIVGYHHWTLSDNIEWADGYCPKFGLYKVLRNESVDAGFGREERPSVHLFKDIIQNRKIVHQTRLDAWKLIKDQFISSNNSSSKVQTSNNRPFCRNSDGYSVPKDIAYRPFQRVDWRFDYNLSLFSYSWWPFTSRYEEYLQMD